MEAKEELRKKSLAIRNNIPNKDFKSRDIYNEIVLSEEYNDANVIAIYYNMGSEVNTTEIILYSLLKEKIILLPKIVDDEMIFVRVNDKTKYQISKFGFHEPIDGEIYDPSKIELFIVPGLAFDIQGNRLGYGGGYYDRYLRELNATKIGLAFEEQLVNSIPTEEKDIPLDIILTEDAKYISEHYKEKLKNKPKKLSLKPAPKRNK